MIASDQICFFNFELIVCLLFILDNLINEWFHQKKVDSRAWTHLNLPFYFSLPLYAHMLWRSFVRLFFLFVDTSSFLKFFLSNWLANGHQSMNQSIVHQSMTMLALFLTALLLPVCLPKLCLHLDLSPLPDFEFLTAFDTSHSTLCLHKLCHTNSATPTRPHQLTHCKFPFSVAFLSVLLFVYRKIHCHIGLLKNKKT